MIRRDDTGKRAAIALVGRALCTAVVVLALARAPCAEARITHAKVRNDDRGLILVSEPFGFSLQGRLELELSALKVNPPHNTVLPPEAYENFGFFLTTSQTELLDEIVSQVDERCSFKDNEMVTPLFTFANQDVQDVLNKVSDSLYYSKAVGEFGEGDYSLFFANCNIDTPVSFNIGLKMFNVLKDGRQDFLSVGEQGLPTLYTITCLAYVGATGAWIAYCWKQKADAHKIHVLMAVLGVLKILTLLTQAGMYHYIRATGDPQGWNIAFYIFTFMRGIMFFSVVILIGTGWSYMKPFLGDNERNILMVVIPLQVFANIAIIILDESTPARKSWFTWRDIFHLLDIICCCAVLFPIVWSIRHLRDAATTDGKVARSIEKLTQFRQFYIMVVVYIYFTRIVVYLLDTTMPYEYVWMSYAASEAATLAFYTVTAIKFRPFKANPYLSLKDDDVSEVQLQEIVQA